MPDDELDAGRLADLALTVDVDAAVDSFGALRRRRSRRRRLGVGSAAALVAVAVGAAALAMASADRDGGADRAQRVDAGPAPGQPVSVSQGGLRLTLEAPAAAQVGTRVWVTVTLANTTDRTLRAGRVGGCDDQVTAGIEAEGSEQHVGPTYLPKGADPSDAPREQRGLLPRYLGPSVEWNGDPSLLGYVLGPQAEPTLWAARPLGVSDEACVAMYVPPAEIAPGEQVRKRLAIDLRWGASAPAGRYEAVAVGGSAVDASGSDGHWPPRNLTVSAPIEITDAPDRADTRDTALAAVGGAPTLPEWAAETADIHAVNGFRQRWFANLSWWDGAWDLWIKPLAGSGHQTDSLRIRWDPERQQVVDVRTVF